MERKELLGINGKIFVEQTEAIAKHAASDIRVLVVGNPCNTNCLIAMNNGRDVPSDRWFAMTRLDENRAKTQLALKAGSHWRQSATSQSGAIIPMPMPPDFYNARIDGKPATEVIDDREWLETTFIKSVQQRGRRSSRRADFPPPNRRRTARLSPSTQLSTRLLERIGTAWRFVQTGAMGSKGVDLLFSYAIGRFQDQHRPRRRSQ